ncbi:MAG: bifunctional lysine-specific demethylase and histidyl-hydroxylase [Bradyrhizobium sp.]|jgi:ribosomal protein L16 Arg81 hydroxylase|nr:bifunctional lysine-specific demethylase and histidyl-hydroxylase [Bradyrhizobium sp.]
MDLRELIAPISPEQFFDRFWEKEVLNVSRNEPSYFPFLTGEQSLEEIIQLFCHEWGDVSLARAGTSAAECPYLTGSPDLQTIAKAFQDKYTVVINDLQVKNIAIGRLCRSLERAIFCRANVNAYLTNTDSQGLRAHYDDDDVFILQIKGEKSWKTYKEPSILPLPGMAYAELGDERSEYDAFKLRPGDLLYIPRGVYHEAITGEQPSLHLTVSLSTFRWNDFVKELVQLSAEDNMALRRSLPPSLLMGTRAERPIDVFDFRAAFESMLNNDRVRKAVRSLQDRLHSGVKQITPIPLVDQARSDLLTENTVLRLAPDQICCVEQADQKCKLKAIGAVFEFPGDMVELARFVCTADLFTPKDLPGALSAKAKVDIATQFIDRGLLVRAG